MLPVYSGTYASIIDAAAADIAARRVSGDLASWLREPIEVLVPSAAVASALTRAIVAKSGGTAGVRIETIETLTARILTLAGIHRRVATGDERSIAMQLALRAEEADDAIFSTPGIPTLLERSWRDAADSGVTLQDLRRRADRHPDWERFAHVLSIWARYEKLLASIASSDPASILQQAIDAVPTLPLPPRMIVGFYDVTQLQERFLRALKEHQRIAAIYLPCRFEADEPAPPYAFATRLVRRLLDGEKPIDTSPARDREKLEVIRRTTRGDEHAAVCRAIAALVASGVSSGTIGVVKRMLNPLDVELLQRSAREFGLAFTRQPRRPLASTRPGRALLLLLAVAPAGFRREDVIELAASGLRSATIRGHRGAERLDEISRRCDIVGGRASEAERVIAQSRFADRDSARDYVTFVAELETITSGIPSSAPGSGWKKALDTLLRFVILESEKDLAAAAVIDELTSAISRFSVPFDRSDITALIREATVEVTSVADGIWLGDVMHARGRRFDHLFVIAGEDDQFPQRRSEDPLLPDGVREHFDVRRIGDGEDEERMLFELLRDAAEERFVVSMAATESGGKLKRPSRFVLQACTELFPDERREIVSDFARWVEAKFDTRPSVSTLAEVQRLRLLTGAAPPLAVKRSLVRASSVRRRSAYDGFIADPQFREATLRRLARISPTRLERFGECPQKFLFSSLLNVDELETPERDLEMEPKKRGQIQHEILERFYRSLDENDYNRADTSSFARLNAGLSDRLRTIIDEHLERFDREHPPANQTMRELDRATLHTTLHRFVGLDLAELATSGYRPKHFEFSFGDEDQNVPSATLQLGDVTLSIRGTIDRVDEQRDGSAVRIVDYKSNNANHLRKISDLAAAGRALQLPLYALAWEQIFSKEAAQINGAIRPLGSALVDDDDFSFNLGELREPLLETLELFARAITEGKFPAVPEHGCRFCAVSHSCRAFYDADERLQLNPFRNAREYLLTLVEK